MAAKPHLAALRQFREQVAVSGLYPRNPEGQAAMSESWGVAAHNGLEEILEDDSIDGILLLTPLLHARDSCE